MGAAINLVGVAANMPNPGVFVELDFAQGQAAGFGGTRSVLIMGNQTTSGIATNDTVVYGPDTQTPCQTESDVIGLFGTGSQLHRAFLRFTAINKVTPLYFIAVAPSAGAAASTTQVIANVATSNGNCRVWCVDQFVDTAITNGQTAIQIATAIVASVNSQTRWPVTAANSGTATVTYTARNLGPEGNWIRMQALITPATGTIATTTTMTANTNLSGGTTADNNTNALATVAATRYYYIVPCDSDSGNVGRLVTQVTNMALPTTGIRQRVVYGSNDSSANVITSATGQNNARAEVVWGGTASDLTPLELASQMAAIYSLLEPGTVGVARKNYSLFPVSNTDQAVWPMIAGRAGAAGALTAPTITSVLNNGISPLTVLPNGSVQLVKRCTTRSQGAGGVADYRIRDAHKVSVCDYWCDDAQAVTQTQFGGKDLLPDPIQGQPPPPSIAVTPSLWRGALQGLVTRYDNAGQWTTLVPGKRGGDVINSNMIVQAESNPPTRMSALVGLTPINVADQFCLLAQQIS